MARTSANARALGSATKFIAYTIIILVVLYSDIMFVNLMWDAFPGGFLTVAAVGGAFATGLSIIALVIGKSHWFRPGGQLIWAWCFTAIEITISVLNVVVSVTKSLGQPLGNLSIWIYCAPATPLVAMVGWVCILYMDRARQQLHETMEMQDDIADSEREHSRQVHEARMELKSAALAQQKEYLKMYMNSEEVQSTIQQGSFHIVAGIVSEIIQRPILPGKTAAPNVSLPAGPIIDTTAQRIDTTPRQHAVSRPAHKKQLPPRRKFTPRLQPATFIETKEVGTPSGPLAPETEKMPAVKPGNGPYRVNRKGAAL